MLYGTLYYVLLLYSVGFGPVLNGFYQVVYFDSAVRLSPRTQSITDVKIRAQLTVSTGYRAGTALNGSENACTILQA